MRPKGQIKSQTVNIRGLTGWRTGRPETPKFCVHTRSTKEHIDLLQKTQGNRAPQERRGGQTPKEQVAIRIKVRRNKTKGKHWIKKEKMKDSTGLVFQPTATRGMCMLSTPVPLCRLYPFRDLESCTQALSSEVG